MDGPVKLSFAIIVATGAFAIAILSFSGSVWPYADVGNARAHLAFANAASFVTFICCLLIFAGGAIAAGRGPAWHARVTNALSGLIFLVGLLTAGIQVTEAMNEWFEASPRMPGFMISMTRIGMLIALVWLLGSAILAARYALKGRQKVELRD
ncbi:hypothetical protein [Henriciella sp.]|uniref:hypothetical protein n=1 Tax=Henriciella sp. TaxID=1968823 RepID=UPI0017D4F9A4|nr:hypothetical protein [Henriciella sp.]HIG22214.1 hypothetical protein [Henriciella sp.]